MPIQATKVNRGKPAALPWAETIPQLEEAYSVKAITNYEAAVWVEMANMAVTTHGGTLKITGEYPSALKATLARLQGIQRNQGELEAARTSILEKLPEAFALYDHAFNFLQWDALGSLQELPEYETQPLNAIAAHIHLYPDNQHGHNQDRFMCLCLGLWFCNYHLGIKITNIEPEAREVALFDAPPPKSKFMGVEP